MHFCGESLHLLPIMEVSWLWRGCCTYFCLLCNLGLEATTPFLGQLRLLGAHRNCVVHYVGYYVAKLLFWLPVDLFFFLGGLPFGLGAVPRLPSATIAFSMALILRSFSCSFPWRSRRFLLFSLFLAFLHLSLWELELDMLLLLSSEVELLSSEELLAVKELLLELLLSFLLFSFFLLLFFLSFFLSLW